MAIYIEISRSTTKYKNTKLHKKIYGAYKLIIRKNIKKLHCISFLRVIYVITKYK